MKRFKKTTFPFLLMLILFMLSGCSAKNVEPLTAEAFDEKMTALGFEVIDAKDQLEDKSVIDCSIAMEQDYQIEFYQFSDNDAAYSSFSYNKDLTESQDGVKVMQKSVNTGSRNSYSATIEGQYILYSRYEDTFIYVVAPKEKKAEIKDIMESFSE